MFENKKKGATDYSKFFEQEREKSETNGISSIKEKRSFLNNLKSFWDGADKKTKIEIIVFLALVSLTIIILIFYMAQSDIGVSENSFYVPAAE